MKKLMLNSVSALAVLTVLLFTRTAHAQSPMQIEDATSAALSALGNPTDVWFGKGQNRAEKGVNVWKFIVVVNQTSLFEVRVNGTTGAKIKVDAAGSTTLLAPAITMNQAAQIGRGVKAGFVWKVEGNATLSAWSVYIAGTDNKQYQIIINSATGAVVRTEVRGGQGMSNDG